MQLSIAAARRAARQMPDAKLRRRRHLLVVGAVAAIGVGGYMLGASEGADVGAAERAGTIAGAQLGKDVGSQAGFESTFKAARERAYRTAYRDAYRTAYIQQFEEADHSPPDAVRVRQP